MYNGSSDVLINFSSKIWHREARWQGIEERGIDYSRISLLLHFIFTLLTTSADQMKILAMGKFVNTDVSTDVSKLKWTDPSTGGNQD